MREEAQLEEVLREEVLLEEVLRQGPLQRVRPTMETFSKAPRQRSAPPARQSTAQSSLPKPCLPRHGAKVGTPSSKRYCAKAPCQRGRARRGTARRGTARRGTSRGPATILQSHVCQDSVPRLSIWFHEGPLQRVRLPMVIDHLGLRSLINTWG